MYLYVDRRLASFDWSQMSIGGPHLPSGFLILFRDTLERLPFIRDFEWTSRIKILLLPLWKCVFLLFIVKCCAKHKMEKDEVLSIYEMVERLQKYM